MTWTTFILRVEFISSLNNFVDNALLPIMLLTIEKILVLCGRHGSILEYEAILLKLFPNWLPNQFGIFLIFYMRGDAKLVVGNIIGKATLA